MQFNSSRDRTTSKRCSKEILFGSRQERRAARSETGPDPPRQLGKKTTDPGSFGQLQRYGRRNAVLDSVWGYGGHHQAAWSGSTALAQDRARRLSYKSEWGRHLLGCCVGSRAFWRVRSTFPDSLYVITLGSSVTKPKTLTNANLGGRKRPRQNGGDHPKTGSRVRRLPLPRSSRRLGGDHW